MDRLHQGPKDSPYSISNSLLAPQSYADQLCDRRNMGIMDPGQLQMRPRHRPAHPTNTAESSTDEGTETKEELKSFMTKILSESDERKKQNGKLESKIDEVLSEIGKELTTLRESIPKEVLKVFKDDEEKKDGQHDNSKQTSECRRENAAIEDRYCNVFIVWRVVLMAAALVLIVSSTITLNSKSCELETALSTIYLELSSTPCIYSSINEKAYFLLSCGIIFLILNIFLLIAFLFISSQSSSEENHHFCLLLIAFILSVASVVYLSAIIGIIAVELKDETTVDYENLRSSMLVWLKNHFTSDEISSSDKISTGWNNFFIRYECCAVNEVIGTTNDFDNTPWCTISGSCQATSSQIPRTCCKFVTQDTYQNASNDCYALLTPGTFKNNCMSAMKKLGTLNMGLSTFLVCVIVLIFQIIDVSLVLTSFVTALRRE
uniref:Uncharacterized protein LOC111111109 isoform X2 n=1 Tax=Crassostrea virginica TaxID=6565 RepID=A0A8B8BKX2_CRAVI|nr:uncharacterized protein LOC111111109 isoform X2 [Crassostrea virginica]